MAGTFGVVMMLVSDGKLMLMSGTGTHPNYCTDQEAMEELNLFNPPCCA